MILMPSARCFRQVKMLLLCYDVTPAMFYSWTLLLVSPTGAKTCLDKPVLSCLTAAAAKVAGHWRLPLALRGGYNTSLLTGNTGLMILVPHLIFSLE